MGIKKPDLPSMEDLGLNEGVGNDAASAFKDNQANAAIISAMDPDPKTIINGVEIRQYTPIPLS